MFRLFSSESSALKTLLKGSSFCSTVLVGFSTKRRPWPILLEIATVDVTCFLFGRGSCSGCFQAISSALKTLLKGSFCSFGGVFCKTKTLLKFVENRKC